MGGRGGGYSEGKWLWSGGEAAVVPWHWRGRVVGAALVVMMVVLPVYYGAGGGRAGWRGKGRGVLVMQIFRCFFEIRIKLCGKQRTEANREGFDFGRSVMTIMIKMII